MVYIADSLYRRYAEKNYPISIRDTVHRPGATGGHTGAVLPQLAACAPKTKIVPPPKRGLCPEKITGSRLLERKSRHKVMFFVD